MADFHGIPVPVGIDLYAVKPGLTASAVPPPPSRQIDFSGPQDFFLFFHRDPFRRGGNGTGSSCLDLLKAEIIALLCNDVDFPEAAAKIPLQDGVALCQEEPAGGCFARRTPFIRFFRDAPRSPFAAWRCARPASAGMSSGGWAMDRTPQAFHSGVLCRTLYVS